MDYKTIQGILSPQNDLLLRYLGSTTGFDYLAKLKQNNSNAVSQSTK